VKIINLGKITHNGAAAVRLTSSTPVTGAVVSTTKGAADYAVSAPSPLLTDAAVVPVVADVDLALEFTGSSERSSGQYDVVGFDRDGEQVFADTVAIDGLRTTEWTPPKKALQSDRPPAYIVVSPSLGADAQAIAQYSDKHGASAIPIAGGIFTVTRPSVTAIR
jgi:hypothetical protein